MVKDRPLVSVVIPAYRASAYITSTLASVFAQTLQSFEVLLVDDGSPDREALEQAIEPYRDRIRYLAQPNRGAGAARNVGIGAACGDWVAFLDADDLWTPRFLERQISRLQSDPSLDLVYSDAVLDGRSPLAGRRYSENAPSRGAVTCESLILQRCNVLTSSVVVRRRLLLSVGCFDETLRRGQDYDLWLRLARAGARMAFQSEPLVIRRVHDDSLSGDAVTQYERVIRVLEKLARQDLTERERGAVGFRLRRLHGALCLERGKILLVEGRHAEAAASLARAARLRPNWRLRVAALAARWMPDLLVFAYRLLSPAGYRELRKGGGAHALPPEPVPALKAGPGSPARTP